MELINGFVFKHYKEVFSNDYAVELNLRWISQGPCEQPEKPRNLPQLMDAFIDQYLWFLPIPRFARLKESMDIDFETVFKGAQVGVHTICDDKLSYVDTHGQKPLVVIDAFFKIGWPHIKFLRRPGQRFFSQQALVLCLMALNPKALMHVNQEAVDEANFKVLAQDIIREELNGEGLYLEGPEDFLKAVGRLLDDRAAKKIELERKGAYDKVLASVPRASDDWLRVVDLRSQNLLSDDLLAKIDAFGLEWTTKLNVVNVEHLDIRIKSIADEDPEIGISNF